MIGYGIQLFEELFENLVLVVQVSVGQFLIQHFYLNDFVSNNNEEEMEPNVVMPPQRDIRETQPTISVNYRVVKNMNDINLKKDQNYSNPDNEDDWDNTNNDW